MFYPKIKKTLLYISLIIISSYIYGVNKTAIFLPYDSINVISINLKNMNKKAGLMDNEFITELHQFLENNNFGDEYNNLSNLFDPELYETKKEEGIVHIFTLSDDNTKVQENTIGFISSLNNKELLEEILVKIKLIKDKNKIDKIKNFNYILKKSFFLAWNDSIFIAIYNIKFSKNKNQAIETFNNIFNNNQNKKSLLSKKTFNDLQSKEWDIAIWTDYGSMVESYIKKNCNYKLLAKNNLDSANEYYKLAKKFKKMSKNNNENNELNENDLALFDGSDFVEKGEYGKAAKWYENKAIIFTEQAKKHQLMDKKYSKQNSIASKKIKNLHMIETVNFLKGNIEFNYNLYAGKNLLFPKSQKNKIDPDLLKYISEDYIFLFGGSVNIKDYYYFLKSVSFGEIAKSIDDFEENLKKENFTLDEVLSMFDGNYYFSLNDFNINSTKINFILSAKINNRKGINKLIDLLIKKQFLIKEKNPNFEIYKISDNNNYKNSSNYYIVLKDDICYITSNEIKENILNNINILSINKEAVEIDKTNSSLSLLNINRLIDVFYNNYNKKEELDIHIIKLKNIIKEIKSSTITINPKNIKSYSTIELVESEKNSLNVLLEWIIDFFKKYKNTLKNRGKKNI